MSALGDYGDRALIFKDDAERAKGFVQGLLRRNLTVDTAVQIALLNNRGLQAAYNELALAEADLVGESLPPNPAFSISRISGDGAYEIERQVVGDILALATLPFRSEIARQRFQKAQLRAAEETLRLAADVRRAYYRAVAANELVGLLTEAKSTAESTAQLAEKLGQTGSLNKLDQAREQVFYAETTAELATLRQEATSSRERLIRLLGLWDGDLGFRLPQKLPALPRRPHSLPRIEVDAVAHRIDLQIARMKLVALAKSLDHGGDPFRHAFGRRRHRPEDARPRHAAFPRARLRRSVPDSDLRRRRSPRPAGGRDLQSGLQPIN